jgi:hypothetical protein
VESGEVISGFFNADFMYKRGSQSLWLLEGVSKLIFNCHCERFPAPALPQAREASCQFGEPVLVARRLLRQKAPRNDNFSRQALRHQADELQSAIVGQTADARESIPNQPNADKPQPNRFKKSPTDRRTQPERYHQLGFLIRWKNLCFFGKESTLKRLLIFIRSKLR